METSIGGGPASAEDLTALAAEAFIYGFPLVFDLEQVDRFDREGIGDLPPSPFNAFSHAGSLAGPEATFVSINNDTLYSIANVDVSGGPVRLEVPPTSATAPRVRSQARFCSWRLTGTGRRRRVPR